MGTKELITNFIVNHFFQGKLKNYVIFHSFPPLADNSRAVFDEFVKRGLNKKYKLVWICNANDDVSIDTDNTIILKSRHSLRERIAIIYCKSKAKALIDCNGDIGKSNNKYKQYEFYVMHGSSTKDVSKFYNLPDSVDYICNMSSFFADKDAYSLKISESRIASLGYPRNDWLFENSVDLHALFPNKSFSKAVYWMPTYRQHKGFDVLNFSSISFPIIYNEEIAFEINENAKKNDILIICKPHFAQDISRIKALNLSNLIFIDEAFLEKNKLQNYLLLGSVDAMLTDYSSVYADYLLCDKPVGLCWDDFDDFNKKEGFVVDVDTFFAGGVKIYNTEDFNRFINDLAAGNDTLRATREKVKAQIHDYTDNKSSQRVADFIIEKAHL